jgi:hypothetical protein
MTKEQAALLHDKGGTFSSPAEYAKQKEEIARSSAERFSRGSVNTNLLTEEALDAEKAERRKHIAEDKSD